MRIIKHEIEKVINIKTILILFIISVLFYKLVIIPKADVIVNKDSVNTVASNMIKDYGVTMENDEFKDFKNKYNEKVKLANDFIKDNEEFSNLSILNYKEFDKIVRNNGEEKYDNPKLQELYYKYEYHDEISLFNELSEIENRLITYEHESSIDEEPFYNVVNNQNENSKEKAISREKEIVERGYRNSLLPYTVFETYDDLVKSVSILILISIIFVISPIYLKDKLEKINYLQYSSKIGRDIFKKKVIATMLVSVLITSIQLIVFFIYYKTQNNSIFLDCNISGHYNSPIKSWYDITFRDYIGLTIACVYLISIAVSMITLYISSKVNTYISLIGIQVTNIFIVSNFLLKILINKVSSMYIVMNKIGYIYLPKYFLPIVYMVLIILPISILYLRNKKELKCDI
ncbi:hypothetical protein [Faecalimicrobium sp. JNUCC 81]